MWIDKIQEALEELKKYMAETPLLAKPVPDEVLYLYLKILEKSLSVILVREEAKIQKSIYYVSKVLYGAGLNYSTIKKFALALIIKSRKLRPYYQAHKIEV